MELDVPDDYQLPSTHPGEFWADLKEKVGDQIQTDLMDMDRIIRTEFPLFDFNLDQLVLDYLQKVYLDEYNGKVTEINLDHVPLNK